MDIKKFYDKMEKIETFGEKVGVNIGTFFNKSIGIIILIGSFVIIGTIAFLYSVKNGIKKS